MTDAATNGRPPILRGPASDAGDARALFARAVAAGGSAFLMRQRWFGEKTQRIAAVEVDDVALADAGGEAVALAVVALAFASGDTVRYFVPLVLTGAEVPPTAVLATVEEPGATLAVVDALAVAAFRNALPAWLAASVQLQGASGRMEWQPGSALGEHLPAGEQIASRVSTAEQSNSSIVYDDRLLLKVFRKLQPGLNPDIEVGCFLTERTSFRNLPPLLGSLTYRPVDPEAPEISLAMAQPFVRSAGDGWSVMLDHLAAHLDGAPGEPAVDLARRLGQRTGQLHLALASDPTDPAFAPEPISAADAARWDADLAAALTRTVADLHARAATLPPTIRAVVDRLSPDDPDLARRRAGFAVLVGVAKTRVHGDYHLGQTLVAPDGDVLILDFEGEPARPLAERRAKTSPLKDVAGMLRSFGYARAAAGRTYAGARATAEVDAALRAWEDAARAAFLDAYLAETRPARAPFLPAGGAAEFAAAVAAWELDKAVYEVNYELNNRPDWLELPLAALAGSNGPPAKGHGP